MSFFSLTIQKFRFSIARNYKHIFPNIMILFRADWRVGIIKAQAQNWARELADTPSNLMTPTIFSQRVSEILTNLGVDVQVHDKSWAEQKKMGSFLSVARGSSEPPKFLEINYKGAENPNESPITFVGKGVTFDAGGISLKVNRVIFFCDIKRGKNLKENNYHDCSRHRKWTKCAPI